MIEVLSAGSTNRDRDLVSKRSDDAKAGIPEYRIVDPDQSRVTVLSLNNADYVVHGEFDPGSTATSVFLSEFSVDVAELFASARSEA